LVGGYFLVLESVIFLFKRGGGGGRMLRDNASYATRVSLSM